MIARYILFAFLIMPFTAHAQKIRVAATTHWTGAMARAAGADTVLVFSPAGLLHPSEYELTPRDVLKFRNVDLIVGGGYERMMERLIEEAGDKNIPVLKIDTFNHPDSLARAVHIIAEKLGTVKKADIWEKEFRTAIEKARSGVNFGNKPVLVHIFQLPFCTWMGMNISGVFGPAELSVKQMVILIRKSPWLVVDNIHNPVGKHVAIDSKAKYVILVNFPGAEGTQNLTDVFLYNIRKLRKLLSDGKENE